MWKALEKSKKRILTMPALIQVRVGSGQHAEDGILCINTCPICELQPLLCMLHLPEGGHFSQLQTKVEGALQWFSRFSITADWDSHRPGPLHSWDVFSSAVL